MMKRWLLNLGRPTHFLRKNGYPACGSGSHVAKDTGAYDPRDVTCFNCRRTKLWRQMMGKNKGQAAK